MAWTNSDIRRLLRYLHSPALDFEPLAKDLQHALGSGSTRDAILTVLERSFDLSDPFALVQYESVALRDIRKLKTRQAAREMHLSNRQYFRYRANAIECIARSIDRILNHDGATHSSEAKLAGFVARFDSDAALKLYAAAAPKPQGKLAYDILLTALRTGKPVTPELIDACKGVWHLLALAAVGRRFITQGQPASSESWRHKVQISLGRVSGRRYDQASFELAYMDRLEAVRRCDMNAAREAAQRMSQFVAGNEALQGLALVAQAEQACDDDDLERADHLLAQVERLSAVAPHFKVLARTAHAHAVLAFMRGRDLEALNLADGAAAALTQVEPGFALCAHANAGRAALQLLRMWRPPDALCLQYPTVWITGHIQSVHARHLLKNDPDAAAQAVTRAVDICAAQNASGAMMYARATRGMVSLVTHRETEAVHDWVEAWEGALNLARASYLVDLFLHSVLGVRVARATLSDPLFVAAAQRRLAKLSAAAGVANPEEHGAGLSDALHFAIQLGIDCVSAATNGSRDLMAAGDAEKKDSPSGVYERLASDISWLLPAVHRRVFRSNFVSGLHRGLMLSQNRGSRAS